MHRDGSFPYGVVVSTEEFRTAQMRISPHHYEPEQCDELEKLVVNHSAEFVLVDGNHRTTAAIIMERPLDLFICRSFGDVNELTEMWYDNKLPSWPHYDYTFRELIGRFAYGFLKNQYAQTLGLRLQEMIDRDAISVEETLSEITKP